MSNLYSDSMWWSLKSILCFSKFPPSSPVTFDCWLLLLEHARYCLQALACAVFCWLTHPIPSCHTASLVSFPDHPVKMSHFQWECSWIFCLMLHHPSTKAPVILYHSPYFTLSSYPLSEFPKVEFLWRQCFYSILFSTKCV